MQEIQTHIRSLVERIMNQEYKKHRDDYRSPIHLTGFTI